MPLPTANAILPTETTFGTAPFINLSVRRQPLAATPCRRSALGSRHDGFRPLSARPHQQHNGAKKHKRRDEGSRSSQRKGGLRSALRNLPLHRKHRPEDRAGAEGSVRAHAIRRRRESERRGCHSLDRNRREKYAWIQRRPETSADQLFDRLPQNTLNAARPRIAVAQGAPAPLAGGPEAFLGLYACRALQPYVESEFPRCTILSSLLRGSDLQLRHQGAAS